MKPILLFISLLVSGVSFAQTDTHTSEQDTTVLIISESMPSFPYGQSAMEKFLQDHLLYPAAEKKANISGTCYVGFVVEKDGSLTRINLLKGITYGKGCDQEAIRVVGEMPKWVPGKQNGKLVRVKFNIPIKFILPIGESTVLKDTTYFTNNWKECTKSDATYYRVFTKEDNYFIVKDVYMKTLSPQMIALSSTMPQINKNGLASFYRQSGEKSKEGSYKNDLVEGFWKFYYENGGLESSGNYKAGKKVGAWNIYYPSGVVKMKCNYENDRNVGITKIWDEDRKDSTVIKYKKNGSYKFKRISVNEPYNNGDSTGHLIEFMPVYKGGQEARAIFILDHIVYPEYEKENKISGICYVSFVVEKDGRMNEIKIFDGSKSTPGFDKEALRVVSMMPPWKPGMTNGKPVRVYLSMPIRFTIAK